MRNKPNFYPQHTFTQHNNINYSLPQLNSHDEMITLKLKSKIYCKNSLNLNSTSEKKTRIWIVPTQQHYNISDKHSLFRTKHGFFLIGSKL